MLRSLLCVLLMSQAVQATEPPKLIAYVPNWIDLPAFVPTIEFDRLTHLNLAFSNPINDAGDLNFTEREARLVRTAHEHPLKVLLSLGGGAASTNPAMQARYMRLLAAPQRTEFVRKLTAFANEHDFDGLDIDLEGPSITSDYAPFIKALQTAWQSTGKLLTAALSQGYGGNKVPIETLRQFDFVNLMAYDATGPWKPLKPGQHSSLKFAQAQVEAWLERGLPASALVLGVPFYGYGFGAEFKESSITYRDILARFPLAAASDEVGSTLYYNGSATILAKAKLVQQRKLGGMMIWSLDGDAAGEASLLRVMHRALRP